MVELLPVDPEATQVILVDRLEVFRVVLVDIHLALADTHPALEDSHLALEGILLALEDTHLVREDSRLVLEDSRLVLEDSRLVLEDSRLVLEDIHPDLAILMVLPIQWQLPLTIGHMLHNSMHKAFLSHQVKVHLQEGSQVSVNLVNLVKRSPVSVNLVLPVNLALVNQVKPHLAELMWIP
jgi:hypothetical protein